MWDEVVGIKYRELADRIVRYVKDEMDEGQIPQPIFIVGASGAGKSTILGMITSILEKEGKTDAPYLLNGKRFFRSQDIVDCIEGKKTETHPLSKDNDNGRRKIVMIDDLDYFFERASFKDQYILRGYLNRESAPLLLATVSSIGESLADYGAPFFEGIRIMYIPKFDESQLKELSMSKNGKRLSAMLQLLPPVVRSFKIASEIVFLSENKESDISLLLDRVGPDYRRSFESIPVNSQKILVALAVSETPMSLSELRQLTGMQSGILSSYLRQLLKSGMIRKINPEKHGTPYEMSDKLLKLWIASDEVV